MYIYYFNTKKNENGYYKLDFIYETNLNIDKIIEFNEKYKTIDKKKRINFFLTEIGLPIINHDNNFCYINIDNLDFINSEVEYYDLDSKNNLSKIKIKEIKDESYDTEYFLFFKHIINFNRKFLLKESDWALLNISDKKIKFTNEELDKIKQLRQDLRDIFKTDKKSIISILKFNNNEWIFNNYNKDKYSYLLDL